MTEIDYRVIVDDHGVAIHEAYYNSSEEVWGITDNPSSPGGETIVELADDLQAMMEALRRPVLRREDYPPSRKPCRQVIVAGFGKGA